MIPSILGVGPFMFECSLVDAPTADFSVALMASRGDQSALSRLGSLDVTTTPLEGSGWARINQFARSWVNTTSPLNRIEEVWLELRRLLDPTFIQHHSERVLQDRTTTP